MHGTRTTAKVLVGVAVAVLSGCVSVATPPPAPEPSPEAGRSAQDVTPQGAEGPQLLEGPAREALEAALPAPAPRKPRATAAGPRAPHSGPPASGQDGTGPSSAPPRRSDAGAVRPPALPEPPRSLDEVCDLGERLGGWRPDSDEARICRGAALP
ncbi:hypothetical protein [Streptomyces sp. NPDC008121]|uniref:hypothetical protein n=1 Tax=Streptomyces sp. NPDC008121 TaxID=3364809 RepID=UPI0036E48E2C